MAKRVCPRCGEHNGGPFYFHANGLCDGCHWDDYIPRGYMEAEAYVLDPVWQHRNATCRPPLHVDLLDRHGLKICDALLSARRKPRG